VVAALDGMGDVADRSVFVARAAMTDQRHTAFFVRRWAELLASDERHRHDYDRFVSLDGYPLVLTRDGRIEMLVPIDVLSWTPTNSAGLRQLGAERRRLFPKARAELRITGQATALAKRMLQADGWTVKERQ